MLEENKDSNWKGKDKINQTNWRRRELTGEK
jgi:hypothetical protein